MKKKEKKGIGCAIIIILLPIPGAIIYGLVSEKSDFAHSFIYGCIISLVFMIFAIISAVKEKKEQRRAEKTEKNRAANAAKYSGVQTSAAAARQSAASVRTISRGAITKVADRRFCPECGADLGEGAKFCRECGTAAASAEGVTIPVTGKVNSVTVSDKPPQRSGAPMSSAKGAADALRRIIAQLADSDVSASASSGEMRLPVTEAQDAFMKLIGKGM